MTTILIIDDDLSMRELLREHLTDAGYTVIDTHHPTHAWKILADNEINIVIMELELSSMSGFAFFEQLKKNSRYTDIDVIMTVGFFDPQVDLMCQRAVIQCISKFDETFYELIVSAVRKI